jgi:hypothetical protein
MELKKANKNGLLQDAHFIQVHRIIYIWLFADLLKRSTNPDVRIYSYLKITLFESQLVCVTDKDSIGYHEI